MFSKCKVQKEKKRFQLNAIYRTQRCLVCLNLLIGKLKWNCRYNCRLRFKKTNVFIFKFGLRYSGMPGIPESIRRNAWWLYLEICEFIVEQHFLSYFSLKCLKFSRAVMRFDNMLNNWIHICLHPLGYPYLNLKFEDRLRQKLYSGIAWKLGNIKIKWWEFYRGK